MSLKPCPLCGGEAVVKEIGFSADCDRTTIACTVCGLTLHHERHFQYSTNRVRVPLDPDAETAWNQRVPDPIATEINLYDKEEIHHNCTVQVWTNTATGQTSIGWWPEGEPPVGDL